MIKQQFHIEQYWKVIVYFDLDYDLFSIVKSDLKSIGATKKMVENIYHSMRDNAKAITFSNYDKHIVLFNSHKTVPDYISSLVHEAEHVKQAMLHVYDVEDIGEPPAYTVGYIAMRMYDGFQKLLSIS